MNLSRLVLVASAIVLLTAACNNTKPGTTAQTQPSPAAPGSAPATPDEFASARANFAKHCKECHGENAEGQTVTKDGKKLKVPSLRTGHALKHPDTEFVKQITKGGDGMPALNGLPSLVLAGAVLLFLGRMPADRSGVEQNLRATERRQARGFRIPLVPAD